MKDNVLAESFRTAGREYGFDDVNAEFTAFKEFKIRWRRSRGKADFRVSDYLRGAGKDILEGVASSIFSRIAGTEKGYPQEMVDWVASDAFIRKKRPVYLRRSTTLTKTSKGVHRDLTDSYRRLTEAGLIKDDADLYLSWTTEQNIRRVGYCSILMKVIAVSSVFDNEMIPEFVLDYVVYHEYLHIAVGFDPFGRNHSQDFVDEEKKYPKREEAEEWVKSLCLYM